MKVSQPRYQYVLEILRQQDAGDWRMLASEPLKVDFQPALACAQFSANRRRGGSTLDFDCSALHIEPLWDAQAGEPFVRGLSIAAPGEAVGTRREARQAADTEIPLAYFAEQARNAASRLVKSGQLQAGDEFRYRVSAYQRQPPRERTAGRALFSVEDETQPLVLPDRSAAEFVARSRPSGQIRDDEMRVFLPRSVLDEAIELMQGAGPAEIGGILIGHLYRDPVLPDIFAVVTAQIPARHAQQELTRLTFTADTWTDVEAAVRLRGLGELYLGWWHTHPARQWCRDCPVENRRQCKLSGEFFSEHDVALHRCVFPRAYSVALVISDSFAQGLTWPLFGWRQGLVQMRGFHLLDVDDRESAADHAT